MTRYEHNVQLVSRVCVHGRPPIGGSQARSGTHLDLVEGLGGALRTRVLEARNAGGAVVAEEDRARRHAAVNEAQTVEVVEDDHERHERL